MADSLILSERRIALFKEKLSSPTATGCIEWIACRNSDGYGEFYVGKGKCGAHRVSYTLEHGPIPDGMHVLHRCDNPACVSPAHLFLGTHSDNMTDMHFKGRKPTPGSFLVSAKRDKSGGLNPRAVLTEAAVRDIRARPESHTEVAGFYQVTATNIRLIRQRKTWVHVHG